MFGEVFREALDATRQDKHEILREAMGNDLSRAYLQLRKYELEQFLAAGNEWTENAGEELTDWELEHYLPFY